MVRQVDRMSRTEQVAAELVGRLVDVGVDGLGPLDPAREVAERARAETGSVDEAVAQVVRGHTRLAAAQGFVTGLGGFLTMPLALPANVAGFYLVATRMSASIAHLHGHDLAREEVRTAVLMTLVGVDAEELLRQAGVAPLGGRVRRMAVQRLPGPAVMVVNKAIAFRLVGQLSTRGLVRLGRGVPLAGGAIGAALDTFLLRRIGDAARREFAP